MNETQKINTLLATFLASYSHKDLEEEFWDIAMSLIFSNDFQNWEPSSQFTAINLLREVGKMFTTIKMLNQNLEL